MKMNIVITTFLIFSFVHITKSFSETESRQFKFTVTVLNTLDNLNNSIKEKRSDIQKASDSYQSKSITFNASMTGMSKAAYIFKNELENDADKDLASFLQDPDDSIREVARTITDNIKLLDKENDEAIQAGSDSLNAGRVDPNTSGRLQADYQIIVGNISKTVEKIIFILGLQIDDNEKQVPSGFIVSNEERAMLLKLIDNKFGDAVEDMYQVMLNQKKEVASEFKWNEPSIISEITVLDISLELNKIRMQGVKDSHYYAIVKYEINLGTGFGKNVTETIEQSGTQVECQKQLEQLKEGQSNIVSSECVSTNGRLISIFNNEPIGRWYARRVTQDKMAKDSLETAMVFDSRDVMKVVSASENPVDFIGNNYFKNRTKVVDPQFIDKGYVVSPYGDVTTYFDSAK